VSTSSWPKTEVSRARASASPDCLLCRAYLGMALLLLTAVEKLVQTVSRSREEASGERLPHHRTIPALELPGVPWR
jgi:hypothetical protein